MLLLDTTQFGGGKEKARVELYGSWEESFQLLYNWKAEIEKRSPGSVVEIDTKIVDGKVYFSQVFLCTCTLH